METIRVDPEKRKQLTSLNLALGGWRTSLELLDQIHRLHLQPNFGLFEGLMVGACVLYGRPFKRAKGLNRLDSLASFTGLPNEDRLAQIHQAAIDARDTVLAHQDVSKWPDLVRGTPGSRPIDETIVTVLPANLGIEAGMLLPQGNLHELLPSLVRLQIQRVDNLRFQLVASCLPPSFSLPAQFRIEAAP